MGSSESKLKSNGGKDKSLPESVPSTPLKSLPSNLQNLCHLDPRSPSEDIFRTPIQIIKDDTDTSSSPLEYVIDPRSPTDQFERTPIVIKGNKTDYPKTLRNKLLDNAKRNITYSPAQTPKTRSDTNSQSSPKLISSIPAFRKCNEKRKSFVGLLETNIDFTETNLDDIVRNKSLDKSLSISITEAPFCEIVEHKNCDPRSPSKDFLRTPIQIVHKVGEVDLNNVTVECESEQVPKFEEFHSSESLLKLADDESSLESEKDIIEEPVVPTQDTVPIELIHNDCEELGLKEGNNKSDSLAVNYVPETEIANIVPRCTLDPYKEVEEEQVENTVQMMAEIVEDLIGNIFSLTTEELKENNHESKETIIDLTADVQEFDKKLTKIIQDNNENFSFKKNIQKEKMSENTRKRTPMKDRNEISEPRRNRLKVSDKPRKLNYDVSKIPVFRDKNGVKTKIQCENTPPAEMNIRKKKSQPRWDSDKTLVI